MPRHNVYPPSTTPGVAPGERLELHWQRDGGVQLATTHWAGAGAPDTATEFLPGTSVNETAPAWAGQFIGLDRGQINHLIKQLRVVRDQAFGRDA